MSSNDHFSWTSVQARLTHFKGTWINLGEIAMVSSEMAGPDGYRREITRVMLKNGREVDLPMGVREFFNHVKEVGAGDFVSPRSESKR